VPATFGTISIFYRISSEENPVELHDLEFDLSDLRSSHDSMQDLLIELWLAAKVRWRLSEYLFKLNGRSSDSTDRAKS